MKYLTLTACFFITILTSFAQNRSLTYDEAILAYNRLASIYGEARMYTYGKTDCGLPLNLFVISKSKIFDPAAIHSSGKCMLMINNGIHPGEPDGIDASVMLATDLLSKPQFKGILDSVVVCIVPVFNIDGSLVRGCCSRVNQDGPEEYGFRANAKNLDLNRDFSKADARNTQSLISILRNWNPDVLVDTHVSDGADYQYTMTLINGQQDKLSKPVGDFMDKKLVPALFDAMLKKGDEMTPYVNPYPDYNSIPDSGIFSFMESPRFLNGYQSLYDCFTFTAESHMLKPFPQRVQSTLRLLTSFVEICNEKCSGIINARKQAALLKPTTYYYNWKLDTTRFEKLQFKGYTAEYKDSKVTNEKRLYYDRNKPYKKEIRNFKYYLPSDSIRIPRYIVIPLAWSDFAQRLEANRVLVTQALEDASATATIYFIENYETVKNPYEGHYLHYNVTCKTEKQKIQIHKGDFIVSFPQANMRFALETLVPDAVDGYFCWGFFDSILMQKEGFSDYVFEDIADSLLNNNPQLKKDFVDWKSKNPKAESTDQLEYIYQHSQYYEKTFKRYPIGFIY